MPQLTRRLALSLAFAAAALALAPGGAAAQTIEGPVILTVSGKIDHPNRGPFDPDVDKFFQYSEAEFDAAAAFDYAALQRLAFVKAAADFPKNGAVQEFEGPLLADVLAAAGMQGETLTLTALDGYAIEAKAGDLIGKGAILAVKRNGRPFALGDFGPAQIVFPRAERPELRDMPDDEWIWSVYHIKVE